MSKDYESLRCDECRWQLPSRYDLRGVCAVCDRQSCIKAFGTWNCNHYKAGKPEDEKK